MRTSTGHIKKCLDEAESPDITVEELRVLVKRLASAATYYKAKDRENILNHARRLVARAESDKAMGRVGNINIPKVAVALEDYQGLHDAVALQQSNVGNTDAWELAIALIELAGVNNHQEGCMFTSDMGCSCIVSKAKQLVGISNREGIVP